LQERKKERRDRLRSPFFARRRSAFRFSQREIYKARRERDEPLRRRVGGGSRIRRVLAWLENIDDGLRERLGRAGLIATNKNVSIGELVELYMEAESPSMKRETISGKRVRFRQSEQRLDFTQRASRLDVADVVRFKARLDADFSEATRAGILKAMARVYSWGESLGYVSSNPFSQVPKGSFSNKKKETFVSRETYRRLIDGCADAELRVLLSLYRIGGLRLGEAFEARWEDVDWDAERFTVRSPKTERCGKDRRVVPLFPELRCELEALRSETRAKDFIVVKRRDKTGVYQAIKKLCAALGVPTWPRLIQNLRASRSNEIYREFNAVAESEWIGHSTVTARKHYLQLLDADFAKATSSGCKNGCGT
jgi:integrase